MKFWESAEVEQSVLESLSRTAKRLEADIAAVFSSRKLSAVDFEFCYIPIVMGPDFLEFYPPRTHFSGGEKKFFHSPQLDFNVFQFGTEEQKAHEYLSGILLAIPELRSVGLTNDQIMEFRTGVEGFYHRSGTGIVSGLS